MHKSGKNEQNSLQGGDDLERLIADLEQCNSLLAKKVRALIRDHITIQSTLKTLEQNCHLIEQASQGWLAAIDAIQDPIFIHDLDMCIIRANRAYAARAGLDVRDVVGQKYWQLFPQLDGPLSSCLQTLEDNISHAEEIRLPSGEIFLSRSFLIHDKKGDYLYSLHLMEDVTAQRQAETEQRTLSEAMRQTAEAILVLDPDWNISYINPAFQHMLGYSAPEILGKSVSELSVPELPIRHQPKEVIRHLNTSGHWQGEVLRRHKDGSAVPVLLNASTIRDANNNITGYVGSYLDLRDIKHAQLALEESEEKFGSITAAALDAIMMIDNDGKLIYWNPAAEHTFGYTAVEALGQDVHRFLAPPRYRDDAARGFAGFRQTGTGHVISKTLELEALHKNGHEFPIELSVSALYLNNQWHAVGIIRDITERKHAERSLRRATRALKTLSGCNSTLIHAQDENVLLQDICHVITGTGGYPIAWIGYAEGGNHKNIKPVAQAGLDPGFLESLQLTWADNEAINNPAGTTIREGISVVIHDAANDPTLDAWREAITSLDIGSMATFPLLDNNETFGVLAICSHEANAFDRDELILLTEMGEDLNFGILNLRARSKHERLQQKHLETAERLKGNLNDTIRAIALTVEKRDPYTSGHQNWVAQLCVAIGNELELDSNCLEGLRLGAIIHDLGKVYVPAEILNRPGKLSAAEFEMIKSHPQVGYEIVKDVKFPWPVAQMILQHHERLDGSGYPNGLRDDEIIPEARILAVADVVEAMAAHRPYRPALGVDRGLQEIEQHRGTLYDTAAAGACLRLFAENRFQFSG